MLLEDEGAREGLATVRHFFLGGEALDGSLAAELARLAATLLVLGAIAAATGK